VSCPLCLAVGPLQVGSSAAYLHSFELFLTADEFSFFFIGKNYYTVRRRIELHESQRAELKHSNAKVHSSQKSRFEIYFSTYSTAYTLLNNMIWVR
jgi:CBS domain containing-hemolysin-like protein